MYSGNQGQRKLGQMSSYIRKNQNAIRSSKGSTNNVMGFGRQNTFKNDDFDQESHNQRMYIKMQNRKQGEAS